jgi:hypothetical protein
LIYGHGEFLHRVDSAVGHDGDEGESIYEIACRLQGFFSAIRSGFFDPFGFAGLTLHNEHRFALRSVMGSVMGMRVNCACARQVPALAPHALAKVIEAILWLASGFDLERAGRWWFRLGVPYLNR